MSEACIKETMDIVNAFKKLAHSIKEKAADGTLSVGERMQVAIEMMGPVGEAMDNISVVKEEFKNLEAEDARVLGGEATGALFELCEALCLLVK